MCVILREHENSQGIRALFQDSKGKQIQRWVPGRCPLYIVFAGQVIKFWKQLHTTAYVKSHEK